MAELGHVRLCRSLIDLYHFKTLRVGAWRMGVTSAKTQRQASREADLLQVQRLGAPAQLSVVSTSLSVSLSMAMRARRYGVSELS